MCMAVVLLFALRFREAAACAYSKVKVRIRKNTRFCFLIYTRLPFSMNETRRGPHLGELA
jgi:hypothetical protein